MTVSKSFDHFIHQLSNFAKSWEMFGDANNSALKLIQIWRNSSGNIFKIITYNKKLESRVTDALVLIASLEFHSNQLMISEQFKFFLAKYLTSKSGGDYTEIELWIQSDWHRAVKYLAISIFWSLFLFANAATWKWT